MKPTNQKARECADELAKLGLIRGSDYADAKQIIDSHFADEPEQPAECKYCAVNGKVNCHIHNQQPDKSLDEIVVKCVSQFASIRSQTAGGKTYADVIRQACIEYAAQLQAKLDAIVQYCDGDICYNRTDIHNIKAMAAQRKESK
jgi:hypothetical protein